LAPFLSGDAVERDAMGKGAKWSAKEDEALAEAWVEVSDPASGVTITSDEFWEAVYARWARLRALEGPTRSEKAVKTRWQVLTHTVQRFEALLAQAAEQNPVEPRDVLYDAANKEFLREEGVPFDRKRVWTVLTSCSRWSSNPRSLRKLMRMRKAAVLEGDDESPSPPWATSSAHPVLRHHLPQVEWTRTPWRLPIWPRLNARRTSWWPTRCS
jgi:hypothetical protein